jgi:hypothetical protein
MDRYPRRACVIDRALTVGETVKERFHAQVRGKYVPSVRPALGASFGWSVAQGGPLVAVRSMRSRWRKTQPTSRCNVSPTGGSASAAWVIKPLICAAAIDGSAADAVSIRAAATVTSAGSNAYSCHFGYDDRGVERGHGLVGRFGPLVVIDRGVSADAHAGLVSLADDEVITIRLFVPLRYCGHVLPNPFAPGDAQAITIFHRPSSPDPISALIRTPRRCGRSYPARRRRQCALRRHHGIGSGSWWATSASRSARCDRMV